MVFGVVAAVVVVVVALLTGHAERESPDDVDCAKVKCVALTFDDGPGPYTDRLLQILQGQRRQGDVLSDRQQGRRESRRRQAHRGRRHGGRQPYLGTPQHDHHPAAGHPRAVQQGERRHRGGDRSAPEAGPYRGRGGQRPGAGGGQAAGPGRHQLGRHPFRLDQRLQHRGDALHADDADQAGISRAVPRHLFQHGRSGVPVHPGAEGQRLPPGDGQPATRTARTGKRLRRHATTARPSTTFTTSPSTRSRRCPTRRRRRRCRTSRSPTSPARTPAGPTTGA